MKIMSEREFQRLIEAAETRGYERAKHEAYMERDERDYRETMWREMRDLRQEVRSRIERLEKATGNEYTPTCGCGEVAVCKPASF